MDTLSRDKKLNLDNKFNNVIWTDDNYVQIPERYTHNNIYDSHLDYMEIIKHLTSTKKFNDIKE